MHGSGNIDGEARRSKPRRRRRTRRSACSPPATTAMTLFLDLHISKRRPWRSKASHLGVSVPIVMNIQDREVCACTNSAELDRKSSAGHSPTKSLAATPTSPTVPPFARSNPGNQSPHQRLTSNPSNPSEVSGSPYRPQVG